MKSRFISLTCLAVVLAGTARASSTLIFPRLSFAPQDLTGIAIVNPGEDRFSHLHRLRGQRTDPERRRLCPDG